MTFEQLRTKFSLPVKHFFKYFQVRNYINTIQGGHLRSLSSLPIDNTNTEKKGSKGFVSYMHVNFNGMGRTHHLQDLNGKKIWNVTLNKILGNLYVKVLHRFHLTVGIDYCSSILYIGYIIHLKDCTRSVFYIQNVALGVKQRLVHYCICFGVVLNLKLTVEI